MASKQKTVGRARTVRAADSVERIYTALKESAVGYKFKPGEKVKEQELAARLSVSRTPVREALNRLVVDGLMTFEPNKGFFCRAIDASEVFNLYDLRVLLEIGALQRTARVASDEDIETVCSNWEKALAIKKGELTLTELAEADEVFHEELAMLSGNLEILKSLRHIDTRIRFFRKIDIDDPARRKATFAEHAKIIRCLRARKFGKARKVLKAHLTMSSSHAVDVTKEGLARIYLK